MNRQTSPHKKSERAQSLVELAISLTVILLLLSGAVSFGMAFFSYVSMRDAAQEGALYGSINPADQAGIIARVQQTSNSPVALSAFARCGGSVTANCVSVSYTTSNICEGVTNGIANGVTVVVSYAYPIYMPFLGAILNSDTIPLTASVTDTILQPVC